MAGGNKEQVKAMLIEAIDDALLDADFSTTAENRDDFELAQDLCRRGNHLEALRYLCRAFPEFYDTAAHFGAAP